MADIRVEQKGTAKWIYYVAAAIVVAAIWMFLANRDDRGSDTQGMRGVTSVDSAGIAVPPAAAAVPQDTMMRRQ